MNRLIYGFCLILLAGCSDSFQNLGPDPATTFVKMHGGGYAQEATDIAATANGFLLLGTTYTSSLGIEGQAYMVETDQAGNEISTRTIDTGLQGGSGHVQSFSPASDGGYLIAGTLTYEQGNTDSWVAKTNAGGEPLWSAAFGDTLAEGRLAHESAVAAVETASGDIYLLGTTNNIDLIKGKGDTPASDSTDLLLIKISQANPTVPVWKKVYGYTGVDRAADLLDLGDGTLALLGTTDYPEGGSLDKDIFVVIVNEDGNAVNTRTFGASGQDETAVRMDLTPGGELAITGNSGPGGPGGSILFMTVSPILTAVTAPVEISSGANSRGVTCTESGNFLITGSGMNNGSEDLLLMEVDAAGATVWGPVYFGDDDGDDTGAAVIPVSDGIAVVGTLAFGSNRMMGLIKTNSMGSLTP